MKKPVSISINAFDYAINKNIINIDGSKRYSVVDIDVTLADGFKNKVKCCMGCLLENPILKNIVNITFSKSNMQ